MRSRAFLFALAILGLLHVYIGWRLAPAVFVSGTLQIAGALALLVLYILVPMGLLAFGIERQPLSDRIAWVGLLAMGLASSLFVLTLGRDVVLLLAELAGWNRKELIVDSARAVPVLAVLVSLIGFVNARRVAQVVDVDVPIVGLPPALHGFTIAQQSDIHVGPTIKRGYLQAIVDVVNTLDADMIAVTGDLVDGSVVQLAPHIAPLADLKARHGAW